VLACSTEEALRLLMRDLDDLSIPAPPECMRSNAPQIAIMTYAGYWDFEPWRFFYARIEVGGRVLYMTVERQRIADLIRVAV